MNMPMLALVRLMWQAPIEEVRSACITAFKKKHHRGLDPRPFQGNDKRLQENHDLMQATIFSLADVDIEAACVVMKEYLEACLSAYSIDKRHREDEDLPSERMLWKAFSFVLRLLFVPEPRFLKLSKLGINSMYFSWPLFCALLEVVEDNQDAYEQRVVVVIARLIRLKMWKIFYGNDELDEVQWAFYEQFFEYVVCSNPESVPIRAQKHLRKAALLVIEDVPFFVDGGYADWAEERAMGVCYDFLWRFYEQSTERYLMERNRCERELGEMDGKQVLAEYEGLVECLRYVPADKDPAELAPNLFARKEKLEQHIQSCVSYMFPLSGGGPV